MIMWWSSKMGLINMGNKLLLTNKVSLFDSFVWFFDLCHSDGSRQKFNFLPYFFAILKAMILKQFLFTRFTINDSFVYFFQVDFIVQPIICAQFRAKKMIFVFRHDIFTVEKFCQVLKDSNDSFGFNQKLSLS